jgi:ribosomal protein S18 acetylase RimI-like enzyme
VTLTIRPSRPEDASAVWRVHERALRARPLPFVEDAPTHADLRAVENHYGPGEFLVGEVNSAVVATGAYRAVEAVGTATVEIPRMRVDPDQQRAGHGEAMLAQLEGRARDEGFQRARLETTVDQAAARALYEANGYRETDRTTVHGLERVVYEKPLSSRAHTATEASTPGPGARRLREAAVVTAGPTR